MSGIPAHAHRCGGSEVLTALLSLLPFAIKKKKRQRTGGKGLVVLIVLSGKWN